MNNVSVIAMDKDEVIKSFNELIEFVETKPFVKNWKYQLIKKINRIKKRFQKQH